MTKIPSSETTDAPETNASFGPVVYIVATPIGHLEVLTPRARRTLAGVDIVAAEDTRQSR